MDRPTLREGDLVLRPATAADADAIAAACQDPEIPRWTNVPSPYTHADAVRYIAFSAEAAAAGRAVNVLAVDSDGALLGTVALMELDREPGYAEVGYWVAAEARGRGVATRAVELLMGWARSELGVARFELLAHAENRASLRVAEKAGFRPTGERRACVRTGTDGPRLVVLRRD